MICLPELNKDVPLLEKVCAAFDLQPRGSAGEHSAGVGAKWDISNKQRLGFSEGQLVQKMVDGIKKLIAIEEKLAAGGTISAEDVPGMCMHNVSEYGGVPSGDAKDTDTFKYFTYPALPAFTDKHKSLMSKTLTPELWDKMKDLKTSGGYTFHNAIQTGVETPHLGVGCTAGDEEAWTLFGDLFNPVIKGWHGYDPETGTHPTDLGFDKVVFTEEDQALFNKYVASTRIRAARNISGYGLPAGNTDEDRAKVEGELKGTYFPLGGMTPEQETDLQSQGFLFQKPKTTNLLTYAGAARNWPASRGIFHNDDKTALCWCNEEDHCRIISMSKDGNVKDVFKRFCSISDALGKSAEANGDKLMHSEKLGFLGTCPSNLGTGMRGSVMICLPELNKDVHLLEKVCAAFDLQPRGSAGEHSAAVGAKWDISNKQRLGFSEVQLVQKMVDGIKKLIAIEEKLAAGGTISAEDVPGMCMHNVSEYGGVPSGDAKDTDTFKYFTYPALPAFTDKHKSLMSKTLTPELWDKMKDLKTSGGYTFHNAIQTGVETPHLGVGCTAGDEECWTLFGDLS